MYEQIIYDACFDLLPAAAFDQLCAKSQNAFKRCQDQHASGSLELFSFDKARRQMDELAPFVKWCQHSFKHVVVLGTGGSSLGGQTFTHLHQLPHACVGDGVRVLFFDNIDPHTFGRIFEKLIPKETLFLVISKSGETAETLTQFLSCYTWASQDITTDTLSQHFVFITEPKDNTLRQIATAHNIMCLDHPTSIGGRYSCFTVVGLLPAAIAAGSADQLLDGALNVFNNPLQAIQGAALLFGLGERGGIKNSVVMPYSDRLKSYTYWYRQLVAESLGKNGKGLTPLNAMGTVDQHSQLQLYLDGPKDKVFTILEEAHRSSFCELWQEPLAMSSLDYLKGHSMGDVIQAELLATIDTLIEHKRPVRTMRFDVLNDYTLGQLMMHTIIETLIMADLMAVNPFDQPAVEQGKILTRQYLKKS